MPPPVALTSVLRRWLKLRRMETTDAPQIIEHVNKPVMFTPYDIRWVPCSARVAAMGMYPRGTGVIQVYEMSAGALNVVTEVRGGRCASVVYVGRGAARS